MGVKSTHRFLLGDARDMTAVADASVQFVCTSPPYPMIQMWDSMFSSLDGQIGELLESEEAWSAWEAMHVQLDRVYAECFRVLSPGCLAVINMGDATRTVAGDFQLFPNHARVVTGMRQAGFVPLPDILWRKPTNSPNKFMGSGMLPAGAYVTYEHEYLLVFRKGSKRVFSTQADKENRRKSAFFWEERNRWFSDVWQDVAGTGQDLPSSAIRSRSAAFPIRIPWRLIQMFSVYGDTVLDPFAGTGTTLAAAAASGRHSIGVERESSLMGGVDSLIRHAAERSAEWSLRRTVEHSDFVADRIRSKKPVRHENEFLGVPVMTRQESQLMLYEADRVVHHPPDRWVVHHIPMMREKSWAKKHG